MINKLVKITVIITTFFCFPVLAEVDCKAYEGKSIDALVTKVADGDTATVRLEASGNKVKVRFYGADTPESKWPGHWPAQAFSGEAKAFTVNALKKQNVKVSFTGEGTYSRCVGEIFINGKSHSLALIESGHAWWYSKYAPNRKDLKKAQQIAKQSKIGLWADSNAQAPWNFRKQYNK